MRYFTCTLELVSNILRMVVTLADIIICLGDFHRAKNLLGIIGKRMKSLESKKL